MNFDFFQNLPNNFVLVFFMTFHPTFWIEEEVFGDFFRRRASSVEEEEDEQAPTSPPRGYNAIRVGARLEYDEDAVTDASWSERSRRSPIPLVDGG